MKKLDVESIKKYVEKTEGKGKISDKELKTLQKEEKIRKAYKDAIQEMIVKDQKVRDEQLEKG